jgi:hypothetical protein
MHTNEMQSCQSHLGPGSDWPHILQITVQPHMTLPSAILQWSLVPSKRLAARCP